MLKRQDEDGGRDRLESATRMQDAALIESIAQARAGNAEAWGEIYQHYAAAIFRFCRRVLPTREDAEDATMDIFLKIRGKLHQYDPSHPFGAWLGQKLLRSAANPGARVAGLALGLFLLRVCFVVPIVNTQVVIVVMIVGLGAVVLAAHERIISSSGRASATAA